MQKTRFKALSDSDKQFIESVAKEFSILIPSTVHLLDLMSLLNEKLKDISLESKAKENIVDWVKGKVLEIKFLEFTKDDLITFVPIILTMIRCASDYCQYAAIDCINHLMDNCTCALLSICDYAEIILESLIGQSQMHQYSAGKSSRMLDCFLLCTVRFLNFCFRKDLEAKCKLARQLAEFINLEMKSEVRTIGYKHAAILLRDINIDCLFVRDVYFRVITNTLRIDVGTNAIQNDEIKAMSVVVEELLKYPIASHGYEYECLLQIYDLARHSPNILHAIENSNKISELKKPFHECNKPKNEVK